MQSAISDTLVEALRKAGLPAEHALPGTPFHAGDVVVAGRVLRIDEGNRTRRIGIGFGAGRSVVQATAELSAIVPDGPPVLLQSYQGSADSGRTPGLAVGASSAIVQSDAGIGVLSATMHAGNETRRSPVAREAASLGSRLARDIGSYAAGRGWIAASAVPPWQR